MNDSQPQKVPSLTTLAGVSTEVDQHERRADDHAWIEVIQRMDTIYADLVHYQVELEEKNDALENAQRFIQSVMSSISDILIVCDINSLIIQVNDALEDETGLVAKDLIGKPLCSLFSSASQSMITEFPEHIRSDSIIDCEIDLLNSERETVPMVVNCSARYDHDNRLSGFVITGRPVGELRKAYSELHTAHEQLKTTQQQLIHSEKMASLGRLVAGVAHELNNPISFLYANMHALQTYEQQIKNYLDAVHRDISSSEREKLRAELKIDHITKDIVPLLEGSMEGAERVSEIVQNLSRFATPQEQKSQAFDLIAVIERASSWVLKAASFRPEIITDYPEHLKLVNSEGHVHQILINLIQNAIDALEHTDMPRLFYSVVSRQKSVDIIVRDNGPGIPDSDMVRVFDPFYTTKPVGSGTGLGLYISYGLAREQCNGNLVARNYSAGGESGAEFILSLPLIKS